MDVSDVGKSGEKLDRSTFSDFLLGWVWPLVKQGYSSVLLEDQIPAMPTELSADVALRNALKYWEEEKKAAVRAGRLPSLERALWKVCRREVLIGCVAGAVAGLCNTVAKPLLLRSLIDGTSDGTPTNTLWFLFAGICFALMVESLGFIINRHAIVDRWLTLFSASFSSLVQRQSMLVATSQMTDVPDLANLVSSDLARIHGNTLSLSLAPIAVTSLASGVVILVYTIGVAGLVGMCPMFLLLGANMCMSKLAHKAEEDNLDLTDKRMGIMTQIIHGIRAIKFCAWETSFSNIVTEARRQECVPLKRFRVLNQGTVQLGRANPYVGAVFAFVFLALKSRNDPEAFRPSDIFAALNVFLSLRVPLIILPESIMYFATMRVSIRRLQRVLEVPLAECHWQKQLQDAPDNDACIVVRNATFLWPALSHAKEPCKNELSIPTPVDERMSLPAGEPLLIDDLNIPQGCFCAVVGSVASGKSSLFSALLGEMPQNKGDSSALVNIHGQSLAFVPQKPFILSGTIRENIIMGAAPPDEDKLRLAIRRAALDKDIAMLPSGEYTEVGERGVVLSGGQQQRLSIARAFYAKSDLLLADDPLSALDPAVADKVFHGLWSYVHESHGSRTCVVILNQLRLLPQFDHVIMVSRGRIVDSGAPSDLLQSGGMLADLCTSAGCLSSMATSPMYLQESIVEYNPEKQSPDRLGSKLVLSEQKLVGALSTSVIVRYIQGMGYCYFAFCVLLIVLCYSSMAFTDFWLASWVDAREKKWNLNEDVDDDFYVGVYGGVAGLFLMFLWISSYCFSSGAVRSSKHLHSECLNTVLRAPVSFFEATPSGRITSRFSNDLAGVDTTIPRWIDNNMQIFATMIVLGVQIAYAVPIMSPILLVCYMCYGFIVKAINQTNREARRYANSAMSPVLTILNESCNGRILLRTMSKVDTFRSLFCQRIDEANRFGYASGSIVTFGQMFVYTLSVLISGTTGALILVQKDSYEPSTVALALTYTFLLPYFFNMFAMIFQFLLNSLGSLERLLQYGHGGIVPEEPPWYMPTEPSQAEPWPSRGEVVFDAVSLVYRPGLPKSVDNISFTVAPSEKIGVVGRSGAGKSSLMVLLFRLHEASEGRILIDGVDISTVGLKSLRSAVAIVPQEPLLISGTVRLNLDPFGDHSDSDLAKVLEEVQLDPSLLINNTAASTLSHGERQLLTVGRTLLWPSRLRVFDEPTSNIDTATDNIIQRLIRSSERLRASTQITIAHRLQTVIDCHRIMVMAAGCLVEVGAPSDLLADPNSELSALARHTGIQSDTKGATSTVTSI